MTVEADQSPESALSAAVEEFQAALDAINGRMLNGSAPTTAELQREEVARAALVIVRRNLWATKVARKSQYSDRGAESQVSPTL